ncbi:Calmodulin-like protein 5 [Hibiscus syriacus]|uniref:Calmodulin-like protein 5 n=1 Tax=Hibiscus syriacus TaxID=106335 RepID=A0A6A3CTJ7_HIBSY|nr:Calmodulin-like protein 5 [Hibiscus syriacus]
MTRKKSLMIRYRNGPIISDKEVNQIIESIDVNGNGFMDIDEFGILYKTIVNEHNEEEDMIDQNRDGFITFEDFRSVLSSLGLKQRRVIEDCEEMITKVDAAGDGKVNFMEFKQMMKGGGFTTLRPS